MLAKHKVAGSTPVTRSIFKALCKQGLFYFSRHERFTAAAACCRRLSSRRNRRGPGFGSRSRDGAVDISPANRRKRKILLLLPSFSFCLPPHFFILLHSWRV